jgi:hypothetical protein
MSYFTELTGDHAILFVNGVYTQVQLYTRNQELFAKHGQGFVRLNSDYSTSKPKLKLESLLT